MTSVKMVLDKVHWTEDFILNPDSGFVTLGKSD